MTETTEEKYMFQLVTPSKKHFDRLVQIKEKYPELTYVSKGYDGLSKEIIDSHEEIIAEVTNILRVSLKRFSSFQNFTPRKNGEWDIRLQYSYDGGGFTGVGYFNHRHWNPEDHGKY